MSTIAIEESEFKRLLDERAALLRQVGDLQDTMSKLVDNTLARRVRAFHLKFGHPVNHTPHVPDDATIRFRLKIVTEEYFEFVEAALDPKDQEDGKVQDAYNLLKQAIERSKIEVSLPEFIDAVEDLKYVLEGTDAVCGVDANPVAAEVHRANMAKDPAYVMAKDSYNGAVGRMPPDATEPGFYVPDPLAKPTKPAGWTPPDIEGCLLKQGWRPTLKTLIERRTTEPVPA